MATDQPAMWVALQHHLPRGVWVTTEDIYRAIQSNVPLQPDDWEPAAEGTRTTRWQRNVRNILQYRKGTREILWSGDARYMIPSSDMAALMEEELNQRLGTWATLQQRGGPTGVAPQLLRELNIYHGQAGIYADKRRTQFITGSDVGVTVSVLHTGSSYPDDLGEDGVVYHYPETARPGRSDANEIEATKWVGRLGLPIFVIAYRSPDSSLRDVHLGGW